MERDRTTSSRLSVLIVMAVLRFQVNTVRHVGCSQNAAMNAGREEGDGNAALVIASVQMTARLS